MKGPETVYYTGLIAQVANQDKFLEFMDGMTVAYPADYAMLQGAVGSSHAPNSGIRVSISSHSGGMNNGHASALVPTYIFDQIKNICIKNLGTTDIRCRDITNLVNGSYRHDAGINAFLREIRTVLAGIVTGSADNTSLLPGIGKAVKAALLKFNGMADAKTEDTSIPRVRALSTGSSTDYSYYQVRVKADKCTAEGLASCDTLSIKRTAYITDSNGNETQMRQPWNISICRFSAKPRTHGNGTVSYDVSTIAGKQELKFSLTDDDMYRVSYAIEHFVSQWERAHLTDFMAGEAQTRQAKEEFFNKM